ncbi:universal stress protein [Pseudomonas matsuisoli]|uniref:UspA domain-containing protein n=1 Tax=Pseudomonas matsuisoli TaxID=1515666 RepID=A0A917PUA0_9PSED|nr:universal stress protein [Pseudomonas matsuisoli]GGJ92850.1 hypothetical protein GCM10009304_18430 [Pseudomonas matsuisoli]
MINMLVATDLSERSTPAIGRAARLVREYGGQWTLVHVVDSDAPADLGARQAEEAMSALKASAERLAEQAGCAPDIVVTHGDVVPTLVETAEQRGVDLLVVGAHRKSALRDFFVGTTVGRVIRSSHIPVLRVVRPALRDYVRSLVALDLSPVSSDALHAASRLGLIDSVDVEAVHAAELLPVGAMAEVVPDPKLVDDMLLEARQKARAFLQEAGLDLADGRLHVRDGEARQVIADQLRDMDADLLVIGTHARRGVQRVLVGSVASSLLDSLDCDVLTVPPAAGHDA